MVLARILVYGIHGGVLAAMGHSMDKVHFFTLGCLVAIDILGQIDGSSRR
jgi:hypothetical protein